MAGRQDGSTVLCEPVLELCQMTALSNAHKREENIFLYLLSLSDENTFMAVMKKEIVADLSFFSQHI